MSAPDSPLHPDDAEEVSTVRPSHEEARSVSLSCEVPDGHLYAANQKSAESGKASGSAQVDPDNAGAQSRIATNDSRPQRMPSNVPTKPYSAFSRRLKWFIVALVGIAAVFSPISSNIFVPAIPTLAIAFSRSEQDISLAVTVYLVFQAVTPSFIAGASDSFGRRPLSIGGLVVYIGANVGLALCPTNAYWLLLVLRAVQATGSSCLIAIGAGCVSDVAEPRERGMFMAIFQVGSMFGPAFGPLLGGVFAQTLGWRAIFWFLVIATGVVLVPLIFFLPETLRSLVGDGSVPPPRLCSSPQQIWEHHKATVRRRQTGEEKVHVERPPPRKYQPLSSFLLLLNPEIFLVFFFTSVVYLEFYSVLTVYSTALKNSYGLNELQIGLCYLPSGIGIIASALINGRVIDYLYRKEEKRVGGDFRKKGDEFRLERTRFIVAIPFLIMFATGCISLGWCLESRAPLAATLVVNFFVGIGSGTINLATVYGQDLKPGQGGAVSASLNLIRCLLGAVGTGTILLLYNAINAGWTLVLLTGLCVICLPMPLVVLHYGPIWRRRRREREEEKERQKKEREASEGSR